MPISDQDEIAASIRQQTHGNTLGIIDEALERVRAGWQNRGYFKVQVSGDAGTLTRNGSDRQIALFVQVDEGLRYTLGGIKFRHNEAISDVEALRACFPIRDGEIFSREKIAKGLENLREAYGEYGYINHTGVPAATFDDGQRRIFLEIDVDEGKQFYVSSINIVGADADLLNDLALTPGQIYNLRLIELFLQRHLPRADVNDPTIQRRRLNERDGTVSLAFDFKLCPD